MNQQHKCVWWGKNKWGQARFVFDHHVTLWGHFFLKLPSGHCTATLYIASGPIPCNNKLHADLSVNLKKKPCYPNTYQFNNFNYQMQKKTRAPLKQAPWKPVAQVFWLLFCLPWPESFICNQAWWYLLSLQPRYIPWLSTFLGGQLLILFKRYIYRFNNQTDDTGVCCRKDLV